MDKSNSPTAYQESGEIMATKHKRKRPQCTTPGCTRLQTGGNRDKCEPCYQVYARAVQKGQTTWKELEKRGLVGPVRIESGPAIKHLAEVLGIQGKPGRPKKTASKPKKGR